VVAGGAEELGGVASSAVEEAEVSVKSTIGCQSEEMKR